MDKRFIEVADYPLKRSRRTAAGGLYMTDEPDEDEDDEDNFGWDI